VHAGEGLRNLEELAGHVRRVPLALEEPGVLDGHGGVGRQDLQDAQVLLIELIHAELGQRHRADDPGSRTEAGPPGGTHRRPGSRR
jgi:hypothetical protein